MSAAFLTKVEVDHETAYQAGLRDSYAWHKRVWEMFPGRQDDARDFLTRLDGINGGFRLLVVSATEPTKPKWCPDFSWHSKPLPESFLEHTRFRFSLIANPTRKVRSESNRKNGRRLPITHREDREVDGKIQPGLLSWLCRKGEQHGFSFEEATVRTIPKPRQWFLKKGAAGVHAATEFVGTLTVTDPARFRDAVAQGVGSAKAFGFGMLCISPAEILDSRLRLAQDLGRHVVESPRFHSGFEFAVHDPGQPIVQHPPQIQRLGLGQPLDQIHHLDSAHQTQKTTNQQNTNHETHRTPHPAILPRLLPQP